MVVQLRCDVVQEPFQQCSRCKRCGLDCRIDLNFRRVGKRKRNAEMEQELAELRHQIKRLKQEKGLLDSPTGHEDDMNGSMVVAGPSSSAPASGLFHGLPLQPLGAGGPPYSMPLQPVSSNLDQYMGQHDAVAGLLEMKSGMDAVMRSPGGRPYRRLENVVLTPGQVDEVFDM